MISVFKILLQTFLLFTFLLVLRNFMLPNNSLKFYYQQYSRNKSSKKKLKLIQHFKNNIGSNAVLFLQETHSNNSKFEPKWKEGFKAMFSFLTENQILVVS